MLLKFGAGNPVSVTLFQSSREDVLIASQPFGGAVIIASFRFIPYKIVISTSKVASKIMLNNMNREFISLKHTLCSMLLSVSLLFQSNIGYADISIRTDYGLTKIYITGDIHKGDYDDFNNALYSITKSGELPRVSLNSNGGDVVEAMKIGSVIRELLIPVYVNPVEEELSDGFQDVYCASACFFILVSSVDRHVSDIVDPSTFKKLPSIGIHRPIYEKEYFAGLSLKKADAEYRQLEKLTNQYLIKMGVPIKIVEKMYSVPNDKVYMINADEFNNDIGGKAIFYEEWINSKCGTMADQEIEDWHLFKRYERYLEGEFTPDRSINTAKEKYTEEYSQYLDNKATKMFACQGSLLRTEMSNRIEQYLKSKPR